MIEIGVFARVFPPGPPEHNAAFIRNAGFTVTQLNLSALGRPTLDATIARNDALTIREAYAQNGVRIWALSGTFNAIDPDQSARRAATEAFRSLVVHAGAFGVRVVTLCTGTRDVTDMWRAHPGNTSPAAWRDLRATLDRLIPAAITSGVRLGIEPEPGNVIADADLAARLLRELGEDARHIAIVLDPANLLTPKTLASQDRILAHAFGVLAEHTAAIHAKDVVIDGYAAAGVGGMDYDLVMRLHASLPAAVPVIAQDLVPDDATRVHAFLPITPPGRVSPSTSRTA